MNPTVINPSADPPANPENNPTPINNPPASTPSMPNSVLNPVFPSSVVATPTPVAPSLSELEQQVSPAVGLPLAGVAPNQPTPGPSGLVIQPQFTHQDAVADLGGEASQTAFSSPAQPIYSANSQPKKRKRLPILAGVGSLLLLLIGGGAVFGLYLPNRSATVWKTGLDRSGEAVNMVYSKATEQSQLKTYEKSQFIVKADVKSKDAKYSGSADFKYDASKSNGIVSFSTIDDKGQKKEASLNFLASTPKGSLLPDIYFRLNGLKLFDADSFFPGLTNYENKWISVDHTYLASLNPATQAAADKKNDLTSDDYLELAKAAVSTTTDYVLTSDDQKAVLTQKSYVGKEKVDGISAFHYKVGINKQHAKDYCKAIINNVMSTAAYKKLSFVDKDTIEKDKATNTKDCQSSIDKDYKDSQEFDIWVDAKYKLIHKIRLYDDQDKESYTEFGQNYKGGNDISLFFAGHEQKSKTDGKFTLDMNMKDGTTKGSIVLTSKEPSDPYEVNASIEAKPYSGEINTDKPAGAIPIKDVLKRIGLDSSTTGTDYPVLGATTVGSDDDQRHVDITSIQTSLENFHKKHGYYPTLAQINNPIWRYISVKDLNGDALKPPKSTSTSLVTVATQQQYGYQPGSCTAGKCTSYTLSAMLDTGIVLKRQNLVVR